MTFAETTSADRRGFERAFDAGESVYRLPIVSHAATISDVVLTVVKLAGQLSGIEHYFLHFTARQTVPLAASEPDGSQGRPETFPLPTLLW